MEGGSIPPSGAWAMMDPFDRPELEDVQRTLSSLIGTPGFMAPEQIRGTPTDARTDQYAIGCILYQMLSGSQVFYGATPQDLLLLHLIQAPEPLRKRVPELEVSNELEALVMRMLAKEPEERYQSLQEIDAELTAELTMLETGQQSQISFHSVAQSQLSFRSGQHSPLSVRSQHSQNSLRSAQSQLSGRGGPGELSIEFSTPVRLRRWPLWAGLMGGVLVALLVLGIWVLPARTSTSQAPPSIDEVQRQRERALAVLSEQARHPVAQIRHGALETLGQSREAQALPVLQGIYQGGNDTDQAGALNAMGQLGERQAVPLLLAALHDAKSPALKWAAAQALIALGEESGVKFLEEVLSSGSKSERLRAALLLCERGHRQALLRLGGLLGDAQGFDSTLLAGLFCQARAGQRQAREQLLARLSDTSNMDGQLLVAAKLNQLGEPAGQSRLSRLAQQPGPQQLLAARLLAAPHEPVGLPLFRAVLDQSHTELSERQIAIDGLGACGQIADLKRLAPLLSAQNPPLLRQRAASASLRVIGRDPQMMAQHSMSWARAAVGDANWLVRYAVVPLIAESDAPDSIALLSQGLRDARPEVRMRAARALGKRPDLESLRSLLPSLCDSDLLVRQAGARATSHLLASAFQNTTEEDEIGRELRQLLKSGAEEEQLVAHVGLLHRGDASHGKELEKLRTSAKAELRALLAELVSGDRNLLSALLTDSDANVRRAAAQHLSKLGDRRSLAVLGEALKLGGLEAVQAYGALLRLGEGAKMPPELENFGDIEQVGLRIAIVASAEELPRPEGVALLIQAEQDPEPFVRRQVAEVAAELTDGKPGSRLLAVLTRLSSDPMDIVRARAEILLSRALSIGHPAEASGKDELK